MGERYGVGFTNEELFMLEQEAGRIRGLAEYNYPGSTRSMSDTRIAEFWGLHNHVVPRLIEAIITDYEVDEDWFSETLESHIERLIQDGTEVLVIHMALDPRFDNNDVFIELSSLEAIDFGDIASRHCVLQTGLVPIRLDEFAAQFELEIEQWLWLAGLPVGQFSPALHGNNQHGNFYLFFYVYDRILPKLDIEEIEREFREHFEQDIRTNIFFELLPGWVDESWYELNHRAFDSFR